MPSWPTSLRDKFMSSGFSLVPRGAMAIDPESGSPLTRVRFTGDVNDISGSVPFEGDEITTFLNFWKYDLQRGSLPFSWSDPVDRAAREFLFTAPPKVTHMGGANWQVDMTLCEMP